MKRCNKPPRWRWFSEVQAIGWAVSAYLAALKGMHGCGGVTASDFADRFTGELQARVWMAGWRKGLDVDFCNAWDLPQLARRADPAFFGAYRNHLPVDSEAPYPAELLGDRDAV